MPADPEEQLRVKELATLLARARRGVRHLSAEQLAALPRLYRYASSLLARLETRADDPRRVAELRQLLLRAHGLLHRDEAIARAGSGGLLARAARYFGRDVPAAVRAEWRLLATSFALVYGLALIAYLLVRDDLALAYSLLDPGAVDREIEQLRGLAAGEPFRGNFTFGQEESAGAAGWIMGNNMRVAVIFFATALLPPLYAYVLAGNSLMLGTYTGVAAHWGQAGNISSILWCHGVLEIQAIVLAGTAGLVLLRGALVPGPWTRAGSMRRAGERALAILAATFPMLFLAGLIEGFVSPHAAAPARIAVAAGSGLALVLWLSLPGPRKADATRRS